jgi:Uma2 family endonuclease
VDDYYRMAEVGILGPDDRVELLDGQVVEMSPIGRRHAASVRRLNQRLSQLLGDKGLIDVQNPVRLGERSEPQPDVTVLKPRADAYATRHPQPDDVLLLIEVADTTLERDLEIKLPLYARAGIPEVWVVDLPGDGIRTHRHPVGEEYMDVRVARRGETLTPVLLPGVTVSVDEILG